MEVLAVFFGGGFGALVRYLLSIMLPKNCSFPYCTIMANFFGCFIAAAVFTYFVIIKSDTNTIYKTLLITGFCGGLSTLSALSLEVMEFIQIGAYIKAILYILFSFIICAISVILGVILVKNNI